MPPPGGVTAVARVLLTEPQAPGSEATWEPVKAKFPEYDQTCVSETAAVAVAAIASNSEEGSGFKWIPDEKSTFRSPSMSSTLGTRCLALEPMACNFRIDRPIISNGFGREKFGAGSETFWRRIIDDPRVFPPEFWQFFLQ